MMNYNMGFITDNERYNQVIDTWTHVNSDLSDILYKTIKMMTKVSTQYL